MSDYHRHIIKPIYEPYTYMVVPSNCYFDTLFQCTTNSRIEMKFQIVTTNWTVYSNLTSSQGRIGIAGIRLCQYKVLWSTSLAASYGGYILSSDSLANGTYTSIQSKSSLTINGTTHKQGSGTTLYSQNLLLFTDQHSTSSNYGWFNGNYCYYCKIYDNDTLVRDFVPCRLHKDTQMYAVDGQWHTKGEIGLWDKVNQKFYANKGTGTVSVVK